jgi:hypothetical protein
MFRSRFIGNSSLLALMRWQQGEDERGHMPRPGAPGKGVTQSEGERDGIHRNSAAREVVKETILREHTSFGCFPSGRS